MEINSLESIASVVHVTELPPLTTVSGMPPVGNVYHLTMGGATSHGQRIVIPLLSVIFSDWEKLSYAM